MGRKDKMIDKEMLELVKKIKSGEELLDDDYKRIITYEHSLLENDLERLSYNSMGNFFNYMNLALTGEKMIEIAPYLPRSCQYMLAALSYNMNNYLLGLDNSLTASKRLCRYNTLNYVREVDEIFNYDDLMNDLGSQIVDYVKDNKRKNKRRVR